MQHFRLDLPFYGLLVRWLILSSIILVSGCQRHYGQTGGFRTPSNEVIGRIKYNWGQNGFINNKKATSGEVVYNGDRVSTGDATSISIAFVDGGFMQLDANTDPDFRKWFEMGRCIIRVFIQFGQVFGETGHACELLLDDRHLSAIAHTKFNLEVGTDYSILSVIHGEISISRPQPEKIRSHQQLIVFEDGRLEVRPLAPREIKQIQHWRKPFVDEVGWCCADEHVFQATPLECEKSRGFFGNAYKEVMRACRVRPVPKGYCCVNGEIRWLSESTCENRRGQFFVDERKAQRFCQRLFPVDGWCCLDGRLFQASLSECQAQRGLFNRDYRAAQNVCRSTEQDQGFCCLNGQVLRQNRPFCLERNGRFFYDKNSAVESCQPSTGQGWCCRNGRLFQASLYDCQKQRGVFNHDYRSAQNSCHPAEPEIGFCCLNGQISRQNRSFCVRSGGQFFTNARVAEQQCVIPETGWCCKNGKVFSANRQSCERIKGRFSNNEKMLRSKCRPMLYIDPNVIKPPARVMPIDPKFIRKRPVIK